MHDLATVYREHIATLAAGYRAALAEHRLDAVVLASGRSAPRSRWDDQAWPLVVGAAFAHWLPLPEPDAFLIIDDGAPRLIRVDGGDYWESPPRAECEFFLDTFAVTTVSAFDQVAALLPRGRVAMVGERTPTFDGVTTATDELVAALEALRTRKSAYEVACLAEANRRAVRGHRAVADRFVTSDASELALHLELLAASQQSDADAPYQGIVARGRHAAILHHTQYDRAARPGADSLLVDAGARYLGYNADITRTWWRGDDGDAHRFGALVDAVDRLQRQVCSEIRVGLRYEALHDRAHELLAEALCALGLGRGEPQTLVERGVTRALLPHGLGHSLGIAVHDVGMRRTPPRPDNRYLRNTSVIEVGQVFTIEPGCYVIDALLAPLRADDRRHLLDWDAIDALARYGGVRIEDDVVVTTDGVRNLTREAWSAA